MSSRSAESRKRLAPLALIGFPVLIYLIVITRGSMNLFAPEGLWKAYNAYALSILNGSMSVSAEAIRAEGVYVNGKAYMYYGALPAALRLPLAPLLDLGEVPVSRLLVLVQAALASLALQIVLTKTYLSNVGGKHCFLSFVLVSLIVWFSSGPWLMVQSALIYNEPFVSGLALCSVFAAMAFWDIGVKERLPGTGRLIIYSILAGLCIHARPTMAISLAGAVVVLIVWPGLRGRSPGALNSLVPRAILPLAIIGLSGVLYLWMNHVRFGSTGTGWQIAGYGYYLIEGDTERFRALRELGQFNAGRVLPNLMIMLFGGAPLHQTLVEQLGLIYIRIEAPLPRLAFTWMAAFAFAGVGLWSLLRGGVRAALSNPGIWLALCFSAGAVLQLAYATITFRYHVELWPPVMWLMLYGFKALPEVARRYSQTVLRRVMIVFGALTVASAVLVWDRYATALAQAPASSPDNYSNPLHPALVRASQRD